MANFEGYQDLKKRATERDYVIYSGLRKADQKPVILKTLRSERPSADVIALLYHEYEVSKELDLPGVIQIYDFIDQQNLYALVLEDMHGISLHEYLQINPLKDLNTFFKLAEQMVCIVRELHKQHIIHKDVKPGNFIIHPKTLETKITNFNFSSKLLHEVQDVVPPNKLEGTLAYMSPEQTGRMNRNIDYRSDFYALGVTFYEMLSDELPFLYEDPLELLHAHLANPVPDISNQMMDVPPVLMQIIKKLMAKDPIDRYQSMLGLQADFERCENELENTGKIESFPLGENDVFDRLNLSQRLYGRTDETKKLLAAYDHASQGEVEALMVCGYSGIGKTMLVNEVHKPMVKHKGYFISGKFDQLQRNTPYTAITQAFNQLARLILVEPETRFESIKKDLISTLGGVAQVIIDLATDFELIIGPQPALEKLVPQEAQSRMMTCFKHFMHVIANENHPLVLFIDDLQWVDSGTLNLLECIMKDDELNHVLLIGAYRENEVDEDHHLWRFFEAMKEYGKKTPLLSLGPLSSIDFYALFKDSFNRDAATVKPFADIIHKRTEGNPFFCKQILMTLYNEDLLFFDYDQCQWNWNFEGITALRITDNVVDLMLYKLTKLPEETQQLLKYAACVGNRFRVDMLIVISGKSTDEIDEILWPALQKELIISLHFDYKRMDAIRHVGSGVSLSKDITFQFAHDKVQQAVYQGLTENEKQKTHLGIARLLLEKEPVACKKERLFEVTDHFNQGIALLADNEKTNVINLNYRAGKQARYANAYQPMSNYLLAALKLINEDDWKNNYDLIFAVNCEFSWSLFLLNNIQEAQESTEPLFSRAKTNLDKVKLHRLQIKIYHSQGQIEKLLEEIITALALLGIKFAAKPTQAHVLLKFAQIKWQRRHFHVESLDEELPKLSDPSIIAASEILAESSFPVYLKSPISGAYLVFVAIRLMLRYGKPKAAAIWFFLWAINLRMFSKNTDFIFRLWTLAERTKLETPDKYSDCMIDQGFALNLSHLRFPPKVAVDHALKSIQDGVESGNTNLVVNAKSILAFVKASECKSLEEIISTFKIAQKSAAESKMKDREYLLEIKLLLSEGRPLDSDTVGQRVKILEQKILKSENISFIANMYVVFIIYYYSAGLFDQAISYYKLLRKNKGMWKLSLISNQAITFAALAFAEHIPHVKTGTRWSYQRHFRRIASELKWLSGECPGNYLHCYLLIRGAKAKLKGHYIEALSLFNQAIENAKKGDFYSLVALGNELASEMLMGLNQPHCAKEYILEAHYYYTRYGDMPKVQELENRYPHCFVERVETSTKSTSPDHPTFRVTTTETTSAALDFMSIIKASQTISGEIILDQLFEKILHIVLENAGAERAVFLKHDKNEWVVMASLEMQQSQEQFKIHNVALKEFRDIPRTVIRYAARSGNPIVLSHAAEDDQYRTDSYILQAQPKSILCLPVLLHEQVVGGIYLENNLTMGAFTEDSVTVLTTLASQIAISLENARNYERIETLYRSTEKFVPKSFLQLLGKKHMEDIRLGDSVEATITVLFSDIRDYTAITEKQSPNEAFAFINEYLKTMGPIIRKHHGFINQYQGDAIMALFPGNPDDGMKAVRDMYRALVFFNKKQAQLNQPVLKVGYGLNTGLAMLGTIGDEERMDANVISDAVNLAARIESLSKFYGAKFLIGETTFESLLDKEDYVFRLIDKVRVKGKEQALYIYEVNLDSAVDKKEKEFFAHYEAAFKIYESGDFAKAKSLFEGCQNERPEDQATTLFIERCVELMERGVPKDWDGTSTMTVK